MTDPSDYDPWYYERKAQRERAPHVVLGALGTPREKERDTDPAPAVPPERWPTLVAIGLGETLDAIERVCRWAQNGKHQGKKWESQTAEHQIGKLLGHLARGMKGELVDEDTGEHPYAHVAARSLMLLGIALGHRE